MTLETLIAAEARRLGFAEIGFAEAGPALSMDTFRRWLAAGYAAGMDYLARHAELRAGPRELLPEVRSVIVAAAVYPVNPDPARGFAMHARGADYHEALRAKLLRLAENIRLHARLPACRVCVDSAPLPEREWALRAGIGWRGRQGQIVSEAAGCCILLGELLVDIALEPSAPAENRCGDCRRCVEACPTQAIREDGLVDARRCISYLTIEHRGEIPAELVKPMGQALFGCDRCTAVCPHNRPDAPVLPEFQPRPMPDAQACLAMTPAEFQQRFAGTTVARLGLERLQRNARVAVANACGG